MSKVLSFIITFVGFFLISIVSILFHEYGHIIMAKLFYNAKYKGIDLGLGKTLFSIGKVSVKSMPIYGYAHFEYKDAESFEKTSRLRKIMPYFGGPLFSILLVFLSYIVAVRLSTSNYDDIYLILANICLNYNLILFFSAIFPTTYFTRASGQPVYSDGMCVLKIIRNESLLA